MTIFALALAAALAAFASWFGFQLLKQNGRILTRLESLERAFEELALASAANGTAADGSGDGGTLARSRIKRDGLERGTKAPDFQIPRVGGGELSLTDFRGRPILLVFSDPQCGPCNVLAPKLERRSRADRMQVVMVSRGDPDANAAKIEEHRLSFPVGLQRHREISRLYAMFATPIAYLIDEDGVIAAPVAKGPGAILGLLSHAASARTHRSSLSATPASIRATT